MQGRAGRAGQWAKVGLVAQEQTTQLACVSELSRVSVNNASADGHVCQGIGLRKA